MKLINNFVFIMVLMKYMIILFLYMGDIFIFYNILIILIFLIIFGFILLCRILDNIYFLGGFILSILGIEGMMECLFV